MVGNNTFTYYCFFSLIISGDFFITLKQYKEIKKDKRLYNYKKENEKTSI